MVVYVGMCGGRVLVRSGRARGAGEYRGRAARVRGAVRPGGRLVGAPGAAQLRPGRDRLRLAWRPHRRRR